ncbi:hypothetical protein KGF57_004756 [Candida theae]|uniref:Uncharacterized protein n=1 Tax=Candida theae TaxID=1198502 RepID=A0AAD5BAC0_9ASCO|nr:uncharacterized protein KGF57_004756 [Candida theae]KAI5949158.1 hypothetical protein KGF57_004756 [Candida theae]
MKFFTIATIASIFAVANAAPTPTSAAVAPTAPVTVAPKAISPVLGDLSTIEKDVEAILSDIQTITPLLVGENSIPAEIVELIQAIASSARDVESIVQIVTGDLNKVFGAAAAAAA